MTPHPHSPSNRSPTTRLAWKRAWTWVIGAVYTPQLVMCLYTLGWVACSHCKAAVCQLAPVAPGLFMWHWGRSLLDLPRGSDGVEWGIAAFLTLLLLTLLAAGLHRAGRGRIPAVVVIALASSWLAFALLAVVRM